MTKKSCNKRVGILKRAFTLVELVVVIAIVAILSAVSVGAYFGITGNAKRSVVTEEAKTLETQYIIWHELNYDNSADIFGNLDAFRNYLVTTEGYKEDPAEKHSINFYVEAEDLETDYLITLYYTASNGLVRTFDLGADVDSLTGAITDNGDFHDNIANAVAGKHVLNNSSYAELTTDALQYASSDGKTVTKKDQYRLMRSAKEGYTTYLPGITKYTEENKDQMYEDIYNDELATNDGKWSDLDQETKNYMITYFINSLVSSGFYYSIIETRVGQKVALPTEITTQTLSISKPAEKMQTDILYPGKPIIKNKNNQLSMVSNFDYWPIDKESTDLNANQIFLDWIITSSPIDYHGETINDAFSYISKNSTDVSPLDIHIYPSCGKTNDISSSTTIPASSIVNLLPEETSSTVYQEKNNTSLQLNNQVSKLTLKKDQTLTIKGTLNIGAIQFYKQPVLSNLNDYSSIELESGSKIIVENGGVLNCYGTINGAGTIEVKDGGKIYEPMNVTDYRGGANATFCVGNNIFPLNQYNLKNISSDVKLYKGSNYSSSTFAYALGSVPQSISIDLLSQDGKPLFKFDESNSNESYVTKSFSNGLTTISLGENTKISAAEPEISMVNTNTPFPVDNILLDIPSTSQLTISTGLQLKLLPTSNINVSGTLNIETGAALAIYDTYDSYKADVVKQYLAIDHTDENGETVKGETVDLGVFAYNKVRNTKTYGLNIKKNGKCEVKISGTISGKIYQEAGSTLTTLKMVTLTTSFKEGFKLGLAKPKYFTTLIPGNTLTATLIKSSSPNSEIKIEAEKTYQ